MGSNAGSFNSLRDKLRSDFSFGLANVMMAEQELAVQIRYINGILGDKLASPWPSFKVRTHVNDMYILETREGKVLQDLATQTTSTTGRCKLGINTLISDNIHDSDQNVSKAAYSNRITWLTIASYSPGPRCWHQ